MSLYENYAPWISLAAEGEDVLTLVVPQRDSVSAGDRPDSGTANEQLLLSVMQLVL